MKDIFGVNFENNQYECENFVVKKADPMMMRKLEKQMEEVNEFSRKARIPNWINFIQSFSFYGGIVTLMLVLLDSIEATIAEAIKKNLVIFIIWIVLSIIGLVVSFYKKRIEKKYTKSKEYLELNEKTQAVIKESLNHLGVPKKGIEVDVYGELFMIKNDQKIPATSRFTHVNNSFIIYKEVDKLYFADATSVYAFNINDIIGLKKVENKLSIYGWNKAGRPTSKEYGLKISGLGAVIVKEYYVLELEIDGEVNMIVIPPYEIDNFNNLLNLEIK